MSNTEHIDEIVIRFYFVSGETLQVKYETKEFENVRNILSQSLNQTIIVGPTFGINFSNVTHYEVQNDLPF